MVVQAEPAAFFHKTQFLLKKTTTENIFFLMSKTNLSFPRGKKMTVFVDIIQTFQQKLEFWKTCVHHHESDSFPILGDFSSEIGGEINECDF